MFYLWNFRTDLNEIINGSGICKEKNFENSGRDGHNFGYLVQPVQRFKNSKIKLKKLKNFAKIDQL
jgi:hypothetical protein